MKPLVRLLAAACLAWPAAARGAPDGRFDGGSAEKLPLEKGPVASAHGSAVATDDRLWISAAAGDAASRSLVAGAGVAIEEIGGGRIGGIATPKAAARLRRLGIPFTAVPLLQRFGAEDFPRADSAFHNYERMQAELKALGAAGAGLASVFSIGQSLQGKDIWALRLNTTASGQEKSPKPGILFLGTHHAREHLSTEVPLLLAKYLIQNRTKPEIASLLGSRDIYIIPMVNPDGVEWDVHDGKYHMQRKNMRDNGDGSVGVDLNRNYGYHWGEGGASDDPGDETYHGPSAFSEPETQAVKAFIDARADTLKVLLTYHSFSELILYPWGHSNAPIPDSKALSAYKAMAAKMAQMTGYTPEQSSELYIASGDTTDWSWGEHKIFSFTFELTPKSMWGGGFYPGAGAIAATFASNISPALYLIGLADDPLRAASDEAAVTSAGPAAPAGGR